jgi:hypothetical protein
MSVKFRKRRESRNADNSSLRIDLWINSMDIKYLIKDKKVKDCQVRHGFKAFLNAIRLFICLFILLNVKVILKLPLNTGRVRR